MQQNEPAKFQEVNESYTMLEAISEASMPSSSALVLASPRHWRLPYFRCH